MIHGSLFSGIGGFDLAAEWTGWTNAFHCEWNPFGQKILKHYWPESVSYDDICKTDFTIWRGKIDILSGGFPCQPYSVAGKRKGTEDTRHLWPEMLRAIRECRPTWIVGENVPGIISWSEGLVFEQVCADMESEGYEVQPVVLPACGVNAPHKRDRCWFVAYSESCNDRRAEREIYQADGRQIGQVLSALSGASCGDGEIRITANAESIKNKRRRQSGFQSKPSGVNDERITAYAPNIRQEPSRPTRERRTRSKNNHIRINPNSRSTGQQERNATDFSDGSRHSTRTPITDWTHWPTVAPICSRDDGIHSRLDGITFSKWRNESIKAYGNAIVPQVAYQIFKVIDEMNKQL